MPYRQVDVRFWEDPQIQGLSPTDRDLLMYYRTNQHSNMLGLYRIPMAYVAEDRGVSIAECEEGTHTLSDKGLLSYDHEHQVVFLPTFLRDNKIVGTKQEKGAIGRLILLPPSPLLKDLKEAIKTFLPQRTALLAAFDEKHLPLGDTAPPERASNGRRTGVERASDVQEQEQDKEQEKKKRSRRKKPATAPGNSEKKERMTRITERYKKLKNVEPHGKEWLPIQKTIKLMLNDGRTEVEIIACMEAFTKAAKNGCEWLQNWTMNTVRLKLPEYTSGVLTLEGGQSIQEHIRQENIRESEKELGSAVHVVTAVENRLAQLTWRKGNVDDAEEADRLKKRLAKYKKIVQNLRREIKKEEAK